MRVSELGVEARKALTGQQIAEVSQWRARDEEWALSAARPEGVRLANRIGDLEKLTSNNQQIAELVQRFHKPRRSKSNASVAH